MYIFFLFQAWCCYFDPAWHHLQIEFLWENSSPYKFLQSSLFSLKCCRDSLKKEEKNGWWKSNHAQRWRHSVRNVQGHIEKNSCHQIVTVNRSFSQLRPLTQRILFWPASRRVFPDPKLLPDGEIALSDSCLWATVWRRIGVLGIRFQPSWTLLLDDLHYSSWHSGKDIQYDLDFVLYPQHNNARINVLKTNQEGEKGNFLSRSGKDQRPLAFRQSNHCTVMIKLY